MAKMVKVSFILKKPDGYHEDIKNIKHTINCEFEYDGVDELKVVVEE